MGPVDPRHAPPGDRRRVPDVEEGRQVVLFAAALAFAEPLEDWKVDIVNDDVGSEGAVELEPLGTLAPLPGGHGGGHAAVVPPSPGHAKLVVGLHVDLGGVYEVGVDCGEVEEGHV